jgi:hypothetical protein
MVGFGCGPTTYAPALKFASVGAAYFVRYIACICSVGATTGGFEAVAGVEEELDEDAAAAAGAASAGLDSAGFDSAGLDSAAGAAADAASAAGWASATGFDSAGLDSAAGTGFDSSTAAAAVDSTAGVGAAAVVSATAAGVDSEDMMVVWRGSFGWVNYRIDVAGASRSVSEEHAQATESDVTIRQRPRGTVSWDREREPATGARMLHFAQSSHRSSIRCARSPSHSPWSLRRTAAARTSAGRQPRAEPSRAPEPRVEKMEAARRDDRQGGHTARTYARIVPVSLTQTYDSQAAGGVRERRLQVEASEIVQPTGFGLV